MSFRTPTFEIGAMPFLLQDGLSKRRLRDSNPHALADAGFQDRGNTNSATRRLIDLTGLTGFEPVHTGVKVLGLTTWR